ncbi:LlaJI family restriction endonuclease [Bacillus toyonensis]|uniref:LlaJI family restriction endonuclease n=1 Tax=Bacillus toyonensis TaxID=155322 RepID=UPI0032F75148|nr:LlaJI family restriction endonuclease [Bacillus toyonensis]
MNLTESVIYFYEAESFRIAEIIDKIGEEFFNELIKKRVCVHIKNGKEITFKFVGVAFYRGSVIFVLPKYALKQKNNRGNLMADILRLLRLYTKKHTKNKEEEFLISNIDNEEVSDFIIADYILTHFTRYGYYEKCEEVSIENGEGQIEWSRTLNEITPHFLKNRPYYLNTYNLITITERNNIIREIHKWAVDFCFEMFGTILGYNNMKIERSLLNINKLGNVEYFKKIIYREINETYVDSNIQLLKSLITLLTRKSNFSKSNLLTLYGTRSFAMVWEDVCSYIFNNEKDNYVNEIEKPRWTNIIGTNVSEEKETFRPDIIKTFSSIDQEYFLILDAKYYLIEFLDGNLVNNPDVNDVAKQLLYEKAFHYKKEKIFRSIFLFPKSEQDELFKPFGFVNLNFIGTTPIILIYVSIEKIFKLYINRNSLSINDMDLFVRQVNQHLNSYPNLK